jgi:hypothetical protein
VTASETRPARPRPSSRALGVLSVAVLLALVTACSVPSAVRATSSGYVAGDVTRPAGVPAPPTNPAAPASSNLAGGVNFHCHWNYTSDAERIRALDMIAAAHLQWVRIDIGWRTVEPTRGAFAAWYVDLYTRCATWAHERGLKVLLTLRRTPDWSHPASTGDNILPDDPAVVQDSTARLGAQFRGLVDAWEVGNEPDAEFVPRDTAGYVQRYLAPSYRGLKQGDPSARVIAGGVTGIDLDWYRALAAAGGLASTDAVVVHPYPSPGQLSPLVPYTSTSASEYQHRFSYLTAIADWIRTTSRPDLPIWATEFGWASTTDQDLARPWWNGVGEQTQGLFATQAIAFIRQNVPSLEVAFWYNFRDRIDSTSTHENSMGLVRRDFSPKPAYLAIQAAFAPQV